MSVASLNNGQLQLSELVISNEKYSNASGYVASSSTFTSNTTGTSLTTGPISTPEVVFTGVAGGTPYLTSGGTTMVLSTPYQGGLLFSSPGATAGAPANQASITLTANQALTCSSASFSALTFRGGIGKFTGNYGFGLNAGETVSNLFTIPNFVGSASSSYVISPNGTGTEVAYPLLWNIAFSSQSGTSTNVDISIFNVGTGTVTGAVDFSVIAIN